MKHRLGPVYGLLIFGSLLLALTAPSPEREAAAPAPAPVVIAPSTPQVVGPMRIETVAGEDALTPAVRDASGPEPGRSHPAPRPRSRG